MSLPAVPAQKSEEGEEHDGEGGSPYGGRGRFDLVFEPADRKVRVPPGVMLFDAASWNGIAIDSTCGGHGTCRKCKVRVLDSAVAVSPLDTRAFTPEELRAGWRLACRVQVSGDLRIEVPPLTTRPKAATVGVGRSVILRPAVQKRYLELTEPSLSDQTTDLERLLQALDDLEPRPDLYLLRSARRCAPRKRLQSDRCGRRRRLIDLEPGDTTGRAFESRSTSGRQLWSRRFSTCRPVRLWRCSRC